MERGELEKRLSLSHFPDFPHFLIFSFSHFQILFMDLSLETFKPLLNSTFVLPFQDADDWDLTLIEVNEHPDIPGQPRKRFSLVFQASETTKYLNQGTYSLQHPELGELHLFLVPMGPGPKEGFNYESVFT